MYMYDKKQFYSSSNDYKERPEYWTWRQLREQMIENSDAEVHQYLQVTIHALVSSIIDNNNIFQRVVKYKWDHAHTSSVQCLNGSVVFVFVCSFYQIDYKNILNMHNTARKKFFYLKTSLTSLVILSRNSSGSLFCALCCTEYYWKCDDKSVPALQVVYN